MILDITEENFNETKEIWENNGIKTYDISLSTADCRVEGNDAIITLRLPHEDALYTDYASIMYWIQGDDGSEREESRAGLSVPSSCTMSVPIGDDDVSSQITSIVSGTAKGLAELRIHCDNAQVLAALIAAPKSVTYLRPMWYTGYGNGNALNPDRLTPDNTVVMEDMRDALECDSMLEGRGQVLNGKKYLFTFERPTNKPKDVPNDRVFNWVNADGISLSPSYYEIIQKDGTENFTEEPNATGALRYDGKFIYTISGCIYVKMKRMNYHLDDEIGYSIDQMDDIHNGVISPTDCTDDLRQVINRFNTDEMININLSRNGLYPVRKTLYFNKPNICIIGHGSQIMAWNPKVNNQGEYVLVGGSTKSDVKVKNVEICDLTFQGLTKYENGAIVNAQEQCISFGKMLFPTNMTFYEVNIDGFETGVHISNEAYSNEPLDIRFIDCNVSRTMFGYNFKACKQVLVSGGSVDNSLSIEKRHHCVYVSKGSNCITVENCVLKNSTGGAIHQMDADKSSKMENNRYRNLTINNCFDGIVIVGYSLDIEVEHIRGEKIGNFIYLHNCGGVVIKDYKATQLPSATIHIGTGTEAHDFRHTDHYKLFHIDYCVDALIENSEFGIDDVSFSENQECPRFMVVSNISTPLDASNYEKGWVEDNCAIANVIFRNCKFSHKSNNYSEIRPYSKSYQRLNFVFDKCEFSVYRETFIKIAVYIFNSSRCKQSKYVLKDCKAYYSIENDFAKEDLFKGYFFKRKDGSLSIEGTYDIVTSFDAAGIKSQNVNDDLA